MLNAAGNLHSNSTNLYGHFDYALQYQANIYTFHIIIQAEENEYMRTERASFFVSHSHFMCTSILFLYGLNRMRFEYSGIL